MENLKHKKSGCPRRSQSSPHATNETSRRSSSPYSMTSIQTPASPSTTVRSRWTTRRATSSAPPWKTPSASPSRSPRRNIRRRSIGTNDANLKAYVAKMKRVMYNKANRVAHIVDVGARLGYT